MIRRHEEAPLENKNRRRVFDVIRANPGLHVGELERRLAMQPGTLAYHLQYLEDLGLVEAREEEYYKRYFAKGEVGRLDRDLLRLLRQRIPRQILAHLLLEDLTHGELAPRFDLAASTLSYHLGKVVGAGVVARDGEGKGARYRVVDKPAVARALVAYRGSWLDDVVDRVVATWLELHP